MNAIKKVKKFFKEDPITSNVIAVEDKVRSFIDLREIVFDEGRDTMTTEEEKEFLENLKDTFISFDIGDPNGFNFEIDYDEGMIVLTISIK